MMEQARRHSSHIRAVELVEQFGAFVKKEQRRQIEAIADWTIADMPFGADWLYDIIDDIERRSKGLLTAPVNLAAGDSEMFDAEVAAAIGFLTGLDRDFAKKSNKRGWNAAHSPVGHWAYAMLEANSQAAIAAVRPFIGTYEGQLRKGGVL